MNYVDFTESTSGIAKNWTMNANTGTTINGLTWYSYEPVE